MINYKDCGCCKPNPQTGSKGKPTPKSARDLKCKAATNAETASKPDKILVTSPKIESEKKTFCGSKMCKKKINIVNSKGEDHSLERTKTTNINATKTFKMLTVKGQEDLKSKLNMKLDVYKGKDKNVGIKPEPTGKEFRELFSISYDNSTQTEELFPWLTTLSDLIEQRHTVGVAFVSMLLAIFLYFVVTLPVEKKSVKHSQFWRKY